MGLGREQPTSDDRPPVSSPRWLLPTVDGDRTRLVFGLCRSFCVLLFCVRSVLVVCPPLKLFTKLKIQTFDRANESSKSPRRDSQEAVIGLYRKTCTINSTIRMTRANGHVFATSLKFSLKIAENKTHHPLFSIDRYSPRIVLPKESL